MGSMSIEASLAVSRMEKGYRGVDRRVICRLTVLIEQNPRTLDACLKPRIIGMSKPPDKETSR